MAINHTIRRHPFRHELVAFAETLVDRNAPVSASMAAHVAACPACAAEVKSIRRSLEFAASAPRLEPSTDLTSQILLQAHKERGGAQEHRRASVGWAVCRGVVYTGLLAAVAVTVFNTALQDSTPMPRAETTLAAQPAVEDEVPSEEALQKAAAEVRTLAAAIRFADSKPQSAREREHRRAVSAMDADIAAARTALERNPGCARATRIVNANLQRQAKALRTLYVERTL
jgi:hypothetical protein